jgi:hypothetical protein
MKFFYILLGCVLLFSSCSVKEYQTNSAKIIILKTPKIKFADTGYIRQSGDSLQIELYSAGVPIKRIEINHLICIDDEGCIRKSSFNAEYLNENYEDDLLLHVTQGEKIFDGKNLTETDDGFKQQIKNSSYDITYRVNKREIYFKDRLNHILIRFKTVLA